METFFGRVTIVMIFLSHSSMSKGIQKGLPVAISCDGFEKDAFHAKEEVLCQVKQNSIVVFNETMIWENRTETEYIFDAQKNETFVVDVIGKNRTAHRNESILVQNPYNPCSTEIEYFDLFDSYPVSDHNKTLACTIPKNIVPKSKLKELSFTFMKDCQTINDSENYSVKPSNSERYIIQINHVSFNKTPGIYTCTIMYKGRHYIFPRMERFDICVKFERPTNDPSIETEATVYKVEPGANLTMKCSVPGQFTKNFNMKVLWEKDGKVLNDGDESEEADRKHFTESQIKTEICSPDPNVNVVELQKKAFGTRTYAYTLRNVKVEDSGSYNCTLRSRRINAAYSTFTVVVKAPVSDSVEGWTIAVIIVAVCSVIVVIAVVLRYKSKREWSFFIKKYFTKRRLVSSGESVAFLVYSEDVFRNNMETNPLQDVIDWMDQTDTPYIDPNKHCLEMSPGDPAPRSIERVIKGSETFIIILSMDLLVKNEIEIYTSYMALKNNVSSSHSVIFICTKEMKNFVFKTGELLGTKLEATEKEAAAKTINTFRNFMKRRGNFVISWSPQKRSSFWKDLYVAVPKVKVCAKNMEVTPMFVNEGVV